MFSKKMVRFVMAVALLFSVVLTTSVVHASPFDDWSNSTLADDTSLITFSNMRATWTNDPIIAGVQHFGFQFSYSSTSPIIADTAGYIITRGSSLRGRITPSCMVMLLGITDVHIPVMPSSLVHLTVGETYTWVAWVTIDGLRYESQPVTFVFEEAPAQTTVQPPPIVEQPQTNGTVTIRYHGNGGTGVPANHTATKDNQGTVQFNISNEVPTRTGRNQYTFIGWLLNNDPAFPLVAPGQFIVHDTQNPSRNETITYFAQWERVLPQRTPQAQTPPAETLPEPTPEVHVPQEQTSQGNRITITTRPDANINPPPQNNASRFFIGEAFGASFYLNANPLEIHDRGMEWRDGNHYTVTAGTTLILESDNEMMESWWRIMELDGLRTTPEGMLDWTVTGVSNWTRINNTSVSAVFNTAGLFLIEGDELGMFFINVAGSNAPSQQQSTGLRLVIDSTAYTQNGVTNHSDVAPFIFDGRTMIPIRLIAETFGANVDWNSSTQAVIIEQGGIVIQLQIGVPLPNDMGTPIIRNDRTFVPVRYVSEMLGITVRWDGDNRAVYIG